MRSIFVKTIFAYCTLVIISTTCLAYDQAVYIWQRNWNPHLQESIQGISSNTSDFAILGGVFSYKGKEPRLEKVAANWSYFTRNHSNLTVVVRMDGSVANLLRNNEALERLVGTISAFLKASIEEAATHNLAVVGVQIDYDCPTSKLANYRKFLVLLKKRFPSVSVSFTALPTWLDNRNFASLAKAADYYVLQVHSFKLPASMEEALKPFSEADTFGWLKKASRFKVPYFVSLPTYGYEVLFDDKGAFLGLRAETEPVVFKNGSKQAIVMTDPEKILAFTTKLDNVNIRGFKGIYWFRLPIKTDEFNWSLDTLKAVMNGRIPQTSIRSEIRSPDQGLFEVSLVNDGEKNVFKNVCFDVLWDSETAPIFDVLAGYTAKPIDGSKGLLISGPAPKVGNKAIIAWFRTERNDKNPFLVSEVRDYEK